MSFFMPISMSYEIVTRSLYSNIAAYISHVFLYANFIAKNWNLYTLKVTPKNKERKNKKSVN